MSALNTFEALIEQLYKEADWMTPDEGYQSGRIGQIKLCVTQLEALAPHYVSKSKVREVANAIKAVAPIVGHYLKREINAPANHQEFQQEAAMKLHKFNSALEGLTALLGEEEGK